MSDNLKISGPDRSDILLLSPPSRIFNHYRPPLALMYLSGYMKKQGLSIGVADVVLRHQVHDRKFKERANFYKAQARQLILQKVKSSECSIVGITCYTPELDEVFDLAGSIRASKPSVKVVVGGVHPTLYPEHFVYKDSPFDAAVIGEGELTFADLCQKLLSDDDLNHVKGIAFFDSRRGMMVTNNRRPIGDNLDEIASPDYSDLDMGYYTTASPYSVRGVYLRSFYISSSRGCPSSCTFCVSRKLRNHHGAAGYARVRSANSLLDEIAELRRNYSIDSFYFIDDLFTLKKGNVFEFCDGLAKSGFSIVWGCSSKVNTVDYEMLMAMRRAGCIQIDFGVEKGSDSALAKIKKGISIRQIKDAFDWCRSLGIRSFANILINTPGETEQDLKDIEALLASISPTVVSANIFTPYPGCEIFDEHCFNIGRGDYSDLIRNPALLIEENPDKYRFAAHNVNLSQWARRVMTQYNHVWPNFVTLLDPRYIKTLLSSRRKMDYLRQSVFLAKEFINQKFSAY